jgi:xanthine/CO dehydrogenase XdhC/CoxF family maturation factor
MMRLSSGTLITCAALPALRVHRGDVPPHDHNAASCCQGRFAVYFRPARRQRHVDIQIVKIQLDSVASRACATSVSATMNATGSPDKPHTPRDRARSGAQLCPAAIGMMSAFSNVQPCGFASASVSTI